MSIRQTARDFDTAYHRLIQGIAHEDRTEASAAYQSWLSARCQMADHQRKASERADLNTVGAIDAMIQESLESLNGNGTTFLEEYPKYLSAREELGKLTQEDLMALLNNASDTPLDQNFFADHAQFDIKSFLDGMANKIRLQHHSAAK